MVWNFLFAHVLPRAAMDSPGGGIGRRAGLKILYTAMYVRVQVPPGARMGVMPENPEGCSISSNLFSLRINALCWKIGSMQGVL